MSAPRAVLETELARLLSAAPPKAEAFRAAREVRVAELRLLLAALSEGQEPDPKVERALRRARGGDSFGR